MRHQHQIFIVFMIYVFLMIKVSAKIWKVDQNLITAARPKK